MATIGDVLRHLVKHASDLGPDHRAEFLRAIDEAEEPETPPEAPAPPVPPAWPASPPGT